MRKAIYFFICFLWVISTDVSAGISLSQAIVHFEEDGKRSEDVEVFNQGDETVYIRVEANVIENPGLENENRTLVRDPKKSGLLVTPQRLIIPAGTRKRLRFVRLNKPEQLSQDAVYRVLVKPEVGEVSAQQTAVKIIVAYEVLVLSQPKNAKINVQHKVNDGWLTLTNLGNTNLLLQKGFQCPKGQSMESESNQCVELAGKRIYAGATWRVKVPFSTPVTYQYSVGLENDSIEFDLDAKKN